jgi:hypothetical protein
MQVFSRKETNKKRYKGYGTRYKEKYIRLAQNFCP